MSEKERKKPLKIAIFSGAIPSVTFIEHLIKGIAAHHKVFLFGTLEKKVHYNSSSILIYKTPKSHWYNLVISAIRTLFLILKNPKALVALLKEVRTHNGAYNQWVWYTKFLPIVLYRPDILHIQWARNIEFYHFLKRDFDIKIILSLRGAHINYSPIVDLKLAEVYRRTFPEVDAFHAVSNAIGLEAQQYNAQALKIKVIHSLVPKKFIDAYTPYTKKNDVIKIVSIGRPHWIKGYHYALMAMSKLKKQGVAFEYTIIGINKVDEALSFQVHSLGLKDCIRFVPMIDQDTLLSKLSQFDALLLSSLKEGIANVVLEAMAVGLPVISTDCGGMSEVIIPNKTGFLIPIRQPEAIMKAIISLSNMTEGEIQAMTLEAHNLVLQQFSSSDKIEEFLALYESLIID